MNNLYKNKKILIFGLGLNQGGVGSAKFFASEGAQVKVTDLKIADILKPSLNQLKIFPKISYTLGEHKYDDINWADLIIKNPAVKPNNPYLKYAKKKGKQIETDMGIFLGYVRPSQIIAVTGTKGKSTTSSLIYEVLKATGQNVILTGNIGKSVLELIPIIQKPTFIPQGCKAKAKEVLAVLELSSFQLEAFKNHKVSPKWAVITNITPDHLNYYQTMEDYIESKKIIGKYQTKSDYLFLKKNDPITTQSNFLNGLKGQITYFSKDDLPKDFHPNLLGVHNLENIAAVWAVLKTFGLDEKTTLETLSSFKGVPFRMELIKEWNGVKIYNDTAATSPEAGIQAIVTLGAKLIHPPGGLILICGGMNKKMDYTKYATAVSKFVKKVFFLEGDSTDAILASLRGAKRRGNLKTYGPYNNLEKLLIDVKKIVKPGDTVLFSPAATSFNLFQNEFDRGRKFNQVVRKVFGDA